MSSLVPTAFHVQRAQELVRSFYTQDTYYLYIGGHVPLSNDNISPSVISGSKQTTDAFDNMIQGKQIRPADVSLMIPRVVWTSNTSYIPFSPTSTSNNHVVVEIGTSYNVYKCLAAPLLTNSTSAPIGTDAFPIKTADGYVWKYMFAVAKTTYDKFRTATKMPFTQDSVNQNAATPGSIDIINIISGGVGYNNYYLNQFRAGDIAVTPTTYKLVETASNLTNFYVGCIIKVTSPSSPAVGQYRRIVAYSVINNVKTITLESAFAANPNPTDAYEIYPEVKIVSSNYTANTAIARAIVNPAQANSISSVEILSAGINHRTATATVLNSATATVVTPATVVPVVSPIYGHGGNPLVELRGQTVGFSSSIGAGDANAAFDSANNDYRQVGIIRNPAFANVSCSMASGAAFTTGESVVQFKTVAYVAANTSLSGITLSGDGTASFTSLSAGDTLLVSGAAGSRLVTVASVASDSILNTTVAVGNIDSATVILVRLTGSGIVRTSNTTNFVLDSASPSISPSLPVYGTASFALNVANNVSFNGNSQSTVFIQAARLIGGTHSAGQFLADEIVTGPTGTAKYHSYTANGSNWTVAVTGISGHIEVGDTITGQSSSASLTINAKYSGDLTVDTGQVVFAENILPMVRIASKAESFRITLEL
jgi:hypothetical protein